MAKPDVDRKPTVALIFSHGIGLRTWFRAGFFDREIDYYRELAAAVGNVVFITYDKSDPTKSEDIPDIDPISVVYNSKWLNHRLFSLLAPLLKYRSLRGVDVIKTNQLFGSWTGVILKWILGKPLLARCGYVWSLNVKRSGASGWRYRITKLIEGFVLKRSNAIAVPDQFALNYLSDLHGIDEERFTILPNFVDTERFHPCERSARSSNGFLFVGRLSEEKRPGLSIAAAAQVPEAHLDVIGTGAELDNVQPIVDGLENVELRGALPHNEVSAAMSGALALVITSRYEGSPKAVIEAMASGLPVIAVKAPGLAEIVVDGVNGLLVEPEAEAIADAMQKLIADKNLWLKLSTGGRQMAVGNYSKSSVLNEELALLGRLMTD